MRDLIVLIHNGAPSDVESTINTRRSLGAFGYRLDELSLADYEAASKLQTLLREERDRIFFFFSSNFWALNIRQDDRLLHQFTDIPLAVLMHDHPIYFLPQISRSLDGAIVFVPDERLSEFVHAYYPAELQTVNNVGWMPHFDDGVPSFDQFSSRRNMLLCPMNLMIGGLNLDDAWHAVKALPVPRRQRAIRVIDAGLTDCQTPLHTISQRLADAGDPDSSIGDLRHVLNFIKLWRRNHLVRALVELPIMISSQYVPADLDFRYRDKFTLLDVQQTWALYREFRFTLNLAPLLTHSFHDRVTNALFRNSVCITDANALIARHFADGRDMIFFDFTADMAGKIARYLDDPQMAFALTVEAAKRRSTLFSNDSYRDLIARVERIWRAKDAGAHASQ